MTFLYFLFGYLGYVIIWGLICLVSYSLAVATKKPSIMYSVSGFGVIAGYILNFLLGLGLLIYMINLLLNKDFLWFFIMLFIGGGVIMWLLSLLQMPFNFIPLFFASLMERKEDFWRHGGKKKDSDRDLAIYFLAAYGLNMLSIFISSQDYQDFGWGDYIIFPFLWVISQILIFGLAKGIYSRIKSGKFFYPYKKAFLSSLLKFIVIFMIVFSVLFLILGKTISSDETPTTINRVSQIESDFQERFNRFSNMISVGLCQEAYDEFITNDSKEKKGENFFYHCKYRKEQWSNFNVLATVFSPDFNRVDIKYSYDLTRPNYDSREFNECFETFEFQLCEKTAPREVVKDDTIETWLFENGKWMRDY